MEQNTQPTIDNIIAEDNGEVNEVETTLVNIVDVEPEDNNSIETDIQQGDLFQLGKHMLKCGDCTDNKYYNFINKPIDMLLTDPPYGVDYSSKNKFLNSLDGGDRNEKPIQNDSIEDYRTFFYNFLTNTSPFLNDYNTTYIFMSGLELHNLRLAFEESGYKFSSYLVWLKNNHTLSRMDYNPKVEYCLYGWKNHHKFYGDFSTDVLEFDKPHTSKLHPTMKPIDLLVKLINDGSPQNGTVLDVFGGSGSTLIACEQTNRACYMMEYDPQYCQVIINRWEELTGKKAVKIT